MNEQEQAFRRLFMDYYPSLLAFALHYVSEEAVAEDLVQDVFVKIWENPDKLEKIEDVSAYVYQMVRFKCLNYLRNERVRADAVRFFAEKLDVSEINAYIKEETFRVVVKAMEDLPPSCRKIFSMSLEGYAEKEVAKELHIAVNTVKKQKQIARRILKKKIGHFFICFMFFWGNSRLNEAMRVWKR